MAERRQISLTQQLKVGSGAHLVYFYSSPDAYVRHAASFIKVGIELKQRVIFIDSRERVALVQEQLRGEIGDEALGHVHFMDSQGGYRADQDGRAERTLPHQADLEGSDAGRPAEIRLWGHAGLREPGKPAAGPGSSRLCPCGFAVPSGAVTVCAYDGETVPASVQTAMLRCHEYFMTDEELVTSGLYRAAAAQTDLESEMNWYKQKLDFVHVVSHEVRNPLTVIKAYASLVMNKVQDAGDKEKLKAICDYVMEIDNEMTHIINTEQMLSSEALWRKKPIQPKNLLAEVIGIMEVKGRTQNIRLDTQVELTDTETMVASAIGFRLTVSNLLSNAIKYSQEGGTVRLRVYEEQRHLYIIVEDDGIGMSEEQLALLFRKYEKMNDERVGQGIGLFMVKKLVDHFQGSIEVWSRPNRGTRMTVKLPLPRGAAEAAPAGVAAGRPESAPAAAHLAAEALVSAGADAAEAAGAGA